MLMQYRKFFEAQTGEVRARGLWLLDLIEAQAIELGKLNMNLPPRARLENFEYRALMRAMRAAGSQAGAARWLGVSRELVSRWCKKFGGIEPKPDEPQPDIYPLPEIASAGAVANRNPPEAPEPVPATKTKMQWVQA